MDNTQFGENTLYVQRMFSTSQTPFTKQFADGEGDKKTFWQRHKGKILGAAALAGAAGLGALGYANKDKIAGAFTSKPRIKTVSWDKIVDTEFHLALNASKNARNLEEAKTHIQAICDQFASLDGKIAAEDLSYAKGKKATIAQELQKIVEDGAKRRDRYPSEVNLFVNWLENKVQYLNSLDIRASM